MNNKDYQDMLEKGEEIINDLGNVVKRWIGKAEETIYKTKNDLKNGTFRTEDVCTFEDCLKWVKGEQSKNPEYTKAMIYRKYISENSPLITENPLELQIMVCFLDEENRPLSDGKFYLINCKAVDETLSEQFGSDDMIVL